MLKNLVKIANRLDYLGLTKEADVIDRYLSKVATGNKTPEQVAEEISDDIYKAKRDIDEFSFKDLFSRYWEVDNTHIPESKDSWMDKADFWADKMWELGTSEPGEVEFGTSEPGEAQRGTGEVALPTETRFDPDSKPPASARPRNVDWTSYEKNVNKRFGQNLGTRVRETWREMTTGMANMGGFDQFVKFYNWLCESEYIGNNPSPSKLLSDKDDLKYKFYKYRHAMSPALSSLGAPKSFTDWKETISNKPNLITRLNSMDLPPEIPISKDQGKPGEKLDMLRDISAYLKEQNLDLEKLSDKELKDIYVQLSEEAENPWLK